jgi:lipopolysaccharide transport system permease protein
MLRFMWPKRKDLAQLYRYANIVWFKTYANLKGETEKTYLGCLWWALEPIINTAIFYIVFVYILKNRSENFVVFLYTGMAIYGWFSGGINVGANSIIAHSGLMQQILLPKPLAVIISVSNVSWKFVFSLAVLFPLIWIHQMPISWSYLTLPILLLLQYFVIISISFPLAMLMPYFQDGRTVLNAFLSVFIWLSGVFFGRDHVPDKFEKWFYLNPIASLIESYRLILLEGKWPNWQALGNVVVIGIIFFSAGLLILKKVDKQLFKMPI